MKFYPPDGNTPASYGSGVFFRQPTSPLGVVSILDIELYFEYDT
jgi:hypothetical protein